jgi:hypothetical protein
MQTKDYSAKAVIEFIGGVYVRAYQFAYDEGEGLFGRVIHRAKPDGHPFDWKTACEYGCMALLCDELIEVSERRRLNRNEAGLFAEACASLLDKQLRQFLQHVGTAAHPMQDYPKYLASSVAEEFEGHGLFPRMVAGVLTQERNKLFDAEEYIRKDNLLTTVAHPMLTFVEWLDRLEHDRAVDPKGYKQMYALRRRVVALHRVGLAVLPPETWRNQVVA